MAFSGVYISQIKNFTYGKFKLVTIQEHQQQNSATVDDISRGGKNSDESRPLEDSSNDYTQANYPGVLDAELTSLTTAQRNIFIVTLVILFVLSICGNMCTLFVNTRRKIRPFFRACLISLAFSDLMNTVFLTTAYLSQFTAEYVQIWRLGYVMCSFVPFATTSAILASSMTLVGIAVDRYFAVMKAVIGFWNPTVISCIVCMLSIWLASIAIACPVFTIYELIPVYILTEEHESANATGWSATTTKPANAVTKTATNIASSVTKRNGLMIMTPKKPNITMITNTLSSSSASLSAVTPTATKTPWEMQASQEDLSYTLVRQLELVDMCVSDQKNVSLYYVIVFVIIFIPCIAAFFWFNCIIARKLWKRRHIAAIGKRKTLKARSKANTTNTFPKLETEAPRTEQPKLNIPNNKTINCKSGHTSSTTVPSSLTNTMMGGRLSTNGNKSCGNTAASSNCNANTNSSREARHLRMFTIILLMMAVFVFLRLPAWIFLLMRMYGSYRKPVHWILYFVFGLMNLASSVLNPLFYTFLSETIQYTLRVKAKVSSLFCVCYNNLCCTCSKNNSKCPASNSSSGLSQTDAESNSPLQRENIEELWLNTIRCYENLCCCGGYLCCLSTPLETESNSLEPDAEGGFKDLGLGINNDNDEGVECNDDLDEDEENVSDFYEYNQRIYTIFPSSLVSSSEHSQIS